ncbi:MAG: hypothetical protein ACO25D_12015, partial [Burkholderiaceae bacterium]
MIDDFRVGERQWGKLELSAADGRNIVINSSTQAVENALGFNATNAGLSSGSVASVSGLTLVATSKITLQSNKLFQISGTANLVGFSVTGVYGVNSNNSV